MTNYLQNHILNQKAEQNLKTFSVTKISEGKEKYRSTCKNRYSRKKILLWNRNLPQNWNMMKTQIFRIIKMGPTVSWKRGKNSTLSREIKTFLFKSPPSAALNLKNPSDLTKIGSKDGHLLMMSLHNEDSSDSNLQIRGQLGVCKGNCQIWSSWILWSHCLRCLSVRKCLVKRRKYKGISQNSRNSRLQKDEINSKNKKIMKYQILPNIKKFK